jgi:hypothetical protein
MSAANNAGLETRATENITPRETSADASEGFAEASETLIEAWKGFVDARQGWEYRAAARKKPGTFELRCGKLPHALFQETEHQHYWRVMRRGAEAQSAADHTSLFRGAVRGMWGARPDGI